MWSQVQASAAVTGHGCPLIRSKHAMCVTPDGHIYLYGGRSMANQALRDFWRFDPNQNQWEEIIPLTLRRKNGSCNQHRNTIASAKFYALGSRHSSGLSSSPSSSCSSSDSANCSPISPFESCECGNTEPPPPLQEHTLLAARNRLYLFGGEVGYSSDETPLWTFNLATGCWYKLASASVLSSPSLCSPLSSPTGTSTTTSRPLSRRGHTAVLYRDLMTIFGGYQDLKGSTGELWTFHLDTDEWSLEANSGTGSKNSSTNFPSPRHSHSAVVYGDDMFIYGGMTDLQIKRDFWRWNFKSKAWHRIKSGIKNPGELCGHSAIVVLDSMLIYGGERANGQGRAELWRYRFATQNWEHLSVGGGGLAPGWRIRHVALANPFLPSAMGTTFYQWSPPAEPMPRIKPERKAKRRQKSQSCQTIDETSFILSPTSEAQVGVTSLEPKKSISLCFDSIEAEELARLRLLSPESEKPPATNIEHSRQTLSPSDSQETKHQDVLNELKAKQLQTPPLPPPPPPLRLRPRRPQLTKQRPYSDFYANNPKDNQMFYSQPTKEEPEDVPPEFKRRSVQESMSYYSLCFATPPAVPKFLSTFNASSNVASNATPMSPLIEPSTPAKDNHKSRDAAATVVLREKSSSIKQRMRRANLELSELIASTSIDRDKQAAPNNARLNSAYYSLSLDISPDYEKELCIPEDSPPTSSNDSMDGYGEMNQCPRRRHPVTDLDMLDDYLEPEEMLEIVATTTDGSTQDSKVYQVEISPTNQTNDSRSSASYPKTPAARKQQNNKSSSNGHHNGTSSAVSHSSSGYQSLVQYAHGGGSSISNSSSFDRPSEVIEYEEERMGGVFVQSLQQQFERSLRLEQDKLARRNETAGATSHAESIPLAEYASTLKSPPAPVKPLRQHHRWPPHVKHRAEASVTSQGEERTPAPTAPVRRSRSLDRKSKPHHHHRASHHSGTHRWEPNIKEVIREVVVPASPNFEKMEQANKSRKWKTKRSFISSITSSSTLSSILSGGGTASHSGGTHRQLAMYVFGGKEEGATGVLNKQSIPVWKLYI